MNIKKITGSDSFLEELKGKKAAFLMAGSVTKTCEVEGITQAGIPGLIHLTPTLDSEFICTGKVFSMPEVAETPKGVPTPGLITRAVHQLKPFETVEILDLGFSTLPQIEECKIHDFGIKPSGSIDRGAGIDAKVVFEKGVEFGKTYETNSDYIIVGESTPSGTTTAQAVAKALGYETEGLFASSFKDVPVSTKEETISKAMKRIEKEKDIFNRLGSVSDNMLLFVGGFLVEASKKREVVLAGGTQMASCLLIVNSLVKELGLKLKASNIGLFTTGWVCNDRDSDIKSILEQLDFIPNAYCNEFSFTLSKLPPLKLYDRGEAKEGVGAGGALCYGLLNGLGEEEIVREVEKFFG